jgi:hypothetical protein
MESLKHYESFRNRIISTLNEDKNSKINKNGDDNKPKSQICEKTSSREVSTSTRNEIENNSYCFLF